ncbi:S9 family peptidase [Ideonella azotifigens]|uniref:S9 family peptidase n=1 Tax=Ideonella azotifigens TaxID=513160 RepID=UPI0011440926|nr:S9 family peptidase [Ideonella azotifigens]MCD2342138.1 S9 family peptidase [Ideonella azotifigens]
MAAFATLPAIQSLALSPDGQHLAGIAHKANGSVVFTSRFDGSELKGALETDDRKFQLNWVRWANNQRLVVSTGFTSKIRGVSIRQSRALAMDADGGHLVQLAPSESFSQDRVVDWNPDDGQHVLMRQFGMILEVDVNTGKDKMLQSGRDYTSWLVDAQHRVRLAVRGREDGVQISVRDNAGADWRVLWRFKAEDPKTVYPIAFGDDPNLLYFTAEENDRLALFSAKLDDLDEAGEPKRHLLAASDADDFAGVRFAPGTHRLIGYTGPGEGDAARAFIPEDLKELARAIDEVLPGRFNRIGPFSADSERYVVSSSGNGVPPELYVGERRSGLLRLVVRQYPELDPSQMTGKRSIGYKSRDGLAIRGYLTLPKGQKPAAGWPMVLMPHGGPIWSDDKDFDPWAELLASRGYAVLQVNFRGSDSQGISFIKAGLKKWGLEMQDDLTDGVQWAVAERHADPSRICVAGASFGGYAALMGAVKTPDLYRCAVSFAGVSDLVTLSRHTADLFNTAGLDKMMGNYWYDRQQLKATSPAQRAAEIKVPVLLVHGTADASVPYEQSELMAKALKSAGKQFEFITQEAGDHQLSLQEHRQEFFAALVRFLDTHLGAGKLVTKAAAN